jgi:hypothetical protein
MCRRSTCWRVSSTVSSIEGRVGSDSCSIAELGRGGGSHFDPSVVEAFLTLMEGPDLLNGETRDAIRSA